MKTLVFPWKIQGKIMAKLGHLPLTEFARRDVINLKGIDCWLGRLRAFGILEYLGPNRYRVQQAAVGFIKACQGLVDNPRLVRKFGRAQALPFLASHSAPDGIAHLPRASGITDPVRRLLTEFFVREGWIEPIEGGRTRLKVGPDIQLLIDGYRQMLASRGPGSLCVLQSGSETAWLIRVVPEWWMLPRNLVASNPSKRPAILYKGLRDLNELDRLLLAAKATTGTSWDRPWNPSSQTVTLLASRLTLNQTLSEEFGYYCSLYGCPDLPDRLMERQLAWSNFPGCTTNAKRIPVTPIAWRARKESRYWADRTLLSATGGRRRVRSLRNSR